MNPRPALLFHKESLTQQSKGGSNYYGAITKKKSTIKAAEQAYECSRQDHVSDMYYPHSLVTVNDKLQDKKERYRVASMLSSTGNQESNLSLRAWRQYSAHRALHTLVSESVLENGAYRAPDLPHARIG